MNADIFALLLKVSVILAVAAIAALLLKNSSAARRHFAWSAAMTSVVVLVLLQLIVPPIVVPIAQHSALAAFAQATTDKLTSPAGAMPRSNAGAGLAEIETSRDVFSEATSNISPTHASSSRVSRSSAGDSATLLCGSDFAGSEQRANPTNKHANVVGAARDLHTASPKLELSQGNQAAEITSGIVSSENVKSPPTSQFSSDLVRAILLNVWWIGSLLLLLRVVLAHWQLRRVARSAQVIDGPACYPDVNRIATRLGVHRTVQVLVHERVTAPCTSGWHKPIILLPVSFADWSDARQRAVFTHELAHIARHDSLAQTMASLACALFWFHPGFWMASRLLRGESERAADDCVINSGMAPTDYADHLIAIAEVSSSYHRVPAVALGMARSSQLELRLRAMLNARQSRTVLTRGAQRVMATAALMAVVPLAGLQARVQGAQSAQPQQQPPAIGPVEPSQTKQPPAKPAGVIPPRTPTTPAATAAPTAPAVARLTPPLVLPTLRSNAIGLPKAPLAVPGPNQGSYVKSSPTSGVVVLPSPGSGIAVPALPVREAVAPPLPIAPAIAPPLVAPPLVAPPLGAPPLVAPPRTRPPTFSLSADTTYDFTIDAKPGDSLLINIPAGGNVIVRGWASNSAKFTARIGGKYWRETRVFLRPWKNGIHLFSAPEIDGDRFAFGMTRNGSKEDIVLVSPITPTATKPYVPTTIDNEFELWVPYKTHVKFSSPIGTLTVRDIEGDIDGTTKLGALDIANTSGKMKLVTDNGDVRVKSSALTGSIHTACGALNVSNSGNTLAATTAFDPSPSTKPGQENIVLIFGGTVHTEYCRLKPRMSAMAGVDESIPYGPIALDSAPNGGTLVTKSGDISLGSSGGVLAAQTSNANIDIRRMTGDITAMNRNGNVDIRVVNTTSTVHNAWIRASTGTVTIELPDSIDAEVDIEVTYTEAYLAKFNRPARIRDDRLLPQTETAFWYRINSEPLRRAVRSNGTLGKGTGRIYIRVTDGDVVLKRGRA